MRAAWVTLVGLVGQLGAGSGGAWASPGEDDLGDGAVFAGVTAPHAANVTSNPAALVRLAPGYHLFAIGALRLDRHAIQRQEVDPATGAASPGVRVADSTLAGGGLGGFAWARASQVFALSFAWRPDERTIDRDATGYQSRGDLARRIDGLMFSGGFRLTGALYLGLSVTLTGRRQQLAFARDTALEAGSDPARGIGSDCGGEACGFEHPLAREEWEVNVDEWWSSDNLGYTVGLLFEVADDVWLGLSTERPWQLGPIEMNGPATITAAPRDGGGTRTGRATIAIRLPVVWRLGVRGRIRPGWDAIGEVRLRRLGRTGVHELHTRGGDLAEGEVPEWYPRPRGLDDAIAAWGGLEQVDDGRGARFGAWLGVDSGATEAAKLSAASPWGAEVAASIGLGLRLRPRWVLQLGTQVRYQVPTDTGASAYDPRARVECVDSGYDRALPACQAVRDGYGLPTAAGEYRRWSHLATVGLRIAL